MRRSSASSQGSASRACSQASGGGLLDELLALLRGQRSAAQGQPLVKGLGGGAVQALPRQARAGAVQLQAGRQRQGASIAAVTGQAEAAQAVQLSPQVAPRGGGVLLRPQPRGQGVARARAVQGQQSQQRQRLARAQVQRLAVAVHGDGADEPQLAHLGIKASDPQALSAASTSSSIFFASPKSMRLFSL